ncbi:hypothetical protein B0H12DRAFT_1241352 [Mycena haematopus]|nr:hypothetical protein B0H12DRAFT_1241352 [Mycena haematopus]
MPRRRAWSASTDALRLAHVCSYWRTIALDTSKLWTTVLIRRASSRHQSSIDHLQFYSSHAKASPLIVQCRRRITRPFLVKLARLSPRWSEIFLIVGNPTLDELDVVRHKIPLLKSLSIHNETVRDGTQTNGTFERAPFLRRIVFTVVSGNVWPFSFILPWEQLTSLTLLPISLPVFSECIRNCPQLLYFHAVIRPRSGATVQPVAEMHHTSLRKLVLQSFGVLDVEVLMAHSFPHLQSLNIVMTGLLHALSGMLHPDLLAFLARSPHLEMFSVRAWPSDTTADLIALLLAVPSLRMLHFCDRRTVMVTPRFDKPLVVRALDDPFDAVEPRSLAELGVEEWTMYNEAELLAFIRTRGERNPLFDPCGIESARLPIENVPFDSEAELDYLSYR